MLPFFYQQGNFKLNDLIVLDKINSNHIIAVLRMQVGEKLILVNGNGKHFNCEITQANKNKCGVKVTKATTIEPRKTKLAIAIGFTKNKSRNEWLLEKVTEIGAEYIIPLQCINSERVSIKEDRIEQLLISAMMQSQQVFLPEFSAIQKPQEVLQNPIFSDYQKLIAHCENGTKNAMTDIMEKGKNALIFIGPEGDFSPEEINELLSSNVKPISLGQNRLRTETAGVYACTVFNQLNYAI